MTEEQEHNKNQSSVDTDDQKNSHFPRNHSDTLKPRSAGNSFLIIVGIALIVIGALTLLPSLLGPLWAPIQASIGFALRLFWPAVLIALGIFAIRIAMTSNSRESDSAMGFRPSMPAEGTRLMRSRRNRIIGGVCGGIAEYFNIDPSIVRIATVALFFIPGVSWLIYVIAWIIIPLDNR